MSDTPSRLTVNTSGAAPTEPLASNVAISSGNSRPFSPASGHWPSKYTIQFRADDKGVYSSKICDTHGQPLDEASNQGASLNQISMLAGQLKDEINGTEVKSLFGFTETFKQFSKDLRRSKTDMLWTGPKVSNASASRGGDTHGDQPSTPSSATLDPSPDFDVFVSLPPEDDKDNVLERSVGGSAL